MKAQVKGYLGQLRGRGRRQTHLYALLAILPVQRQLVHRRRLGCILAAGQVQVQHLVVHLACSVGGRKSDEGCVMGDKICDVKSL